jgi:hypothetical protein
MKEALGLAWLVVPDPLQALRIGIVATATNDRVIPLRVIGLR